MISKQTSELLAREESTLLSVVAKLDLVPVRGQGMFFQDADGRRILDFYSGHGVVSTGHCHPTVVEAIHRQAGELIFFSGIAPMSIRAEAAERLLALAGGGFREVFFLNAGTEAIEAAIRVARRATGRDRLVALKGSFHGRTTASLSITELAYYRKGVSGLWDDVIFADPDDAAALEAAVDERTAAVVLEPIQGLGGCRPVPFESLRRVRAACDRHGAWFIADEVQCGVGRSGRFLAIEHAGVQPDLACLAKGIASGVPASALLLTAKSAATVSQGDLGTTFGGGPLACAAMAATMRVIAEERLVENAATVGARLAEACTSLPKVRRVQGRGLMLGLVLEVPAKEAQKRLLEAGVLTGTSSPPDVLRLLPPLVIRDEHVSAFASAWKAAFA